MNTTSQLTWGKLDPTDIKKFSTNGYLIVHDFVSPDICRTLCRSILEYAANNSIVEVRETQTIFDTFNGSQVDHQIPVLKEFYDEHLLQEMQRLCPGPIATLTNRQVGLSINITHCGGKFQPHFDRHILTAVLYVNDDYEGGEMWFYPRLRHFIRTENRLVRRLLVAADKIVRTRWYRSVFARKIRFKPRIGDLLIFEGTRTYHSVTEITGGEARLSAQFGYDHPDTSYDTSNYYGN